MRREREIEPKKRRGGPERERRIFKKRPCRLCKEKIESINYKDSDYLSKFISDRGRIVPSRITGSCAKHQRMIANAVKRARIADLLPFVRIRPGIQRRPRGGRNENYFA